MTQPATQAPTSPRRRGGGFAILGWVLVIILLAALGVVGWFGWQFYQQQQQLRANFSQQQALVTAQQQQLAKLNTDLQQVIQQQQHRVQDWSLGEAEYLVRLASLALVFQGDIKNALTLLSMADQQLASINDPTLTPVRQALAKNMTELRALPPVDVVSLLAQLNALSQQITQLTVTNTEMQKTGSDHAPVTPSNTAEQSASVWHRAWNNVGHAFKQMVVVRHVDQPAQPLISPEQQAFLIENIQLKLAQAEWAALHRDVGVYQASLHQAQTWVQQYFANNAATQSVIATLNNLLQVNIKPDLPSLDDTIRAIQAALVKTINNQPTTTSSH